VQVIGVGGGGSNVVNRMMADNLQASESVPASTDVGALFHTAPTLDVRDSIPLAVLRR
jgi:cell division protein FtsZ